MIQLKNEKCNILYGFKFKLKVCTKKLLHIYLWNIIGGSNIAYESVIISVNSYIRCHQKHESFHKQLLNLCHHSSYTLGDRYQNTVLVGFQQVLLETNISIIKVTQLNQLYSIFSKINKILIYTRTHGKYSRQS